MNRFESKKKNYYRRNDFTLIEIMIVVVIIGMLAALVGPNIIGSLDKAKVKNTKVQLVNLKNSVQQYYLDISEYPAKLEDLLTNPGNDKWDGPYMESDSVPKDHWNNEYQYSCPGDKHPFEIYSFGGDKVSGGTGNDADISCWN
ncbi:MAG: type II secretion system major pseudopilin GspG [Lentisphaeria bacterium]